VTITRIIIIKILISIIIILMCKGGTVWGSVERKGERVLGGFKRIKTLHKCI
jgi:hypothetical protein